MDSEKHDSQIVKENKSLFGRPASVRVGPGKMISSLKTSLTEVRKLFSCA